MTAGREAKSLPPSLSPSPPQEFSPQAEINWNHFFGGVYVEKVLCGPNSARSPSSKRWRSHFFDTQRAITVQF